MSVYFDWLMVYEGDVFFIVSFLYIGSELLYDLIGDYYLLWLVCCDVDWWVYELYDFVCGMGVIMVCLVILCLVIDFNCDFSGVLLYLGQNIIGLCLLIIFDNQLLYYVGCELDDVEIVCCCDIYFLFYYDVLVVQIVCLCVCYGMVVVYDVYLICLYILYLFDGELLQFNLGIVGFFGVLDMFCDNVLSDVVENLLKISGMSQVCNGCFKGGWIICYYSNIVGGVYSLQMELVCCGYMYEFLLDQVDEYSWFILFDFDYVVLLCYILVQVFNVCFEFVMNWSVV